MRTQTYIFLQKLRCPKCGRILAGGATHKIKYDKWYFYYRCEDCKNNIKEETIEDSVKVLLSDILEYDNVVNEFFLPVLKSKLDNPKKELEKELKPLNNKKDRIRKAYIDSIFTEEEYKNELELIENQIKNINSKLLDNSQAEQLNFTTEDILLKRDMDFINKVKLPMLYKAIVECWEDLDREEKSRIIMNYIDDIKLTKNSLNQYVVESVNFRTTFYKDFKKLYDDGFIDWKRKFIYDFNGIRIDSKVRYSEYLPFQKVYEHLKRLSDCYDVAFYKGTYYKDTEKVDMLPLKKGEVIVRMFPTEEDDSNKDRIGMGMICVSDSPNDIHVDYHDLFESIPE